MRRTSDARTTVPAAIAGAAKRSDAPVASCATELAYPKGKTKKSNPAAQAAHATPRCRHTKNGAVSAASSAIDANGDAIKPPYSVLAGATIAWLHKIALRASQSTSTPPVESHSAGRDLLVASAI